MSIIKKEFSETLIFIQINASHSKILGTKGITSLHP